MASDGGKRTDGTVSILIMAAMPHRLMRAWSILCPHLQRRLLVDSGGTASFTGGLQGAQS